MAESEKNARRSDEAERSRHLSATESVAFATMLLGLLNDSDAVLHRLEHEGQARANAAASQAPPAEAATAPAGASPADENQQAGTVDRPATDSAPATHAGAAATIPSPDASGAVDDTSSAGVVSTEAFTSPAPSSFSVSMEHAPSAGASSAPASSIASFSLDLGATVHTITGTVTGLIDTALATVSSAIASLSSTVAQLTSAPTDTVSHLTDGLLSATTGPAHDAPNTSVLEPLVADFLGPALSPVDTTSHEVSLLDTAGAIPTSLLHPMPLQLGFLGQPTMDGHEPHDGAFSALGVHHF